MKTVRRVETKVVGSKHRKLRLNDIKAASRMSPDTPSQKPFS